MPIFQGRQAGSFGGLGGSMRIETIGVAQARSGLLKLAGYLEELTPPIRAAKQILKQDTQQRFDSQTTPNGENWTPLDPDYSVYKESLGHGGDPILTLSGRLRRQASSEDAWMVGADSIFFNFGAVPNYGVWHQGGVGDAENVGIAAGMRELVDASRASGGATSSEGGRKESLGIGRGKALPARPFVGASEEAELQILEVFDMWFDVGVRRTINISRAGIVSERVGGRISNQIFPNF